MTDVWGGGVVIAATALLWLAYLIPSWNRRHRYTVAERAAVRIQRTLHLMAEASELPEEIRVEATARQAVRQAKVVRKTRRLDEARARAEARAVVAGRKAELETARRRAHEAAAQARRSVRVRDAGRYPLAEAARAARMPFAASRRRVLQRRRRTRLVGTAAVAAGLAGILTASVASSGPAVWLLGALSCTIGVAGAALLVLLARIPVPVLSARREESIVNASTPRETAARPAATSGGRAWTPVPLPKPLHLEPGTRAAEAMAAADAASRWRRESELATLEAGLTRPAPKAPVQHPAAVASSGSEVRPPATQHGEAQGVGVSTVSRYATMGRADAGVAGARLDLDAVLRRRRAV